MYFCYNTGDTRLLLQESYNHVGEKSICRRLTLNAKELPTIVGVFLSTPLLKENQQGFALSECLL